MSEPTANNHPGYEQGRRDGILAVFRVAGYATTASIAAAAIAHFTGYSHMEMNFDNVMRMGTSFGVLGTFAAGAWELGVKPYVIPAAKKVAGRFYQRIKPFIGLPTAGL